MFNYIVETPRDGHARPRYLTTGVSMLVHVMVVGLAIGLPILYASDELPDPPTMMAFVMEAPPPPPPPPPPAPPAPEKKPTQPAKPNQPVLQKPITASPVSPAAAPIEAPKAITPETGNESAATSSAARIEAGFEGGVEGGVAGGTVGGVDVGAPPPPPPPPPPPAPKPQGPVRVGGQVKAPQLSHRVAPVYPVAAQTAQVEGVVVLEATVGPDGRVDSVRVVKAHPLLQGAAIDAVKQWRYEPLELNGQPVPFILTVTVSFSIPR